jgi:ssDNA-binding Zn-finger/Zn-ribbon topoisomerase 1
MPDPSNDSSPSRYHFCPDCKKPLRRRQGKMGPFWGCTGYPECTTTLNDVDGKPSEQADLHYRCPLCTRHLVRSGKGDDKYWFCSGYSKGCKVTLADKDGTPETTYRCRECGQLLVKRTGKNGIFWGCSSYPECTASYRDKDNEPQL